MKRTIAIVTIVLSTLVSATAASASQPTPSHSTAGGASTTTLAQRYLGWLFGSDTNPLMQENFCGEIVGGTFFLTVATVPNLEVSCVVPVGVPIAASPGGNIVWQPTDGNTDAELLASLENTLGAIASPSLVLDGKQLGIDQELTRTGVFTMALGDNSFVKAVDPNVPSEWASTRSAGAAWIGRLHPLSKGMHTLVASDTIDGDAYVATYHITVSSR